MAQTSVPEIAARSVRVRVSARHEKDGALTAMSTRSDGEKGGSNEQDDCGDAGDSCAGFYGAERALKGERRERESAEDGGRGRARAGC